jgi:hypothetical protein
MVACILWYPAKRLYDTAKAPDYANAVEELAGGIDDPTWYEGPNSPKNVETRDSSYEGELDRSSLARDAEGMDGGARGRDPRLSKRAPTGGLLGALSSAFQGADPGPSARSTPPSDGEGCFSGSYLSIHSQEAPPGNTKSKITRSNRYYQAILTAFMKPKTPPPTAPERLRESR